MGRLAHTPEQKEWIRRNRSEAQKLRDNKWKQQRATFNRKARRESIKRAQEACPTIVSLKLQYPPVSDQEIAERVGCCRATLFNWQDAFPEMFAAEFERQVAILRAQRQVLEVVGVNQVRNLAAVGGPKAMETILEIAETGTSKDRTRLSASQEILKQLHTFVDVNAASNGFSDGTRDFLAQEVAREKGQGAEGDARVQGGHAALRLEAGTEGDESEAGDGDSDERGGEVETEDKEEEVEVA